MNNLPEYEEIINSYDFFTDQWLPKQYYNYKTLHFIGNGSYGKVYSCKLHYSD